MVTAATLIFQVGLKQLLAYLAHHLIRVIKLIWLRCCGSTYSVAFIHCTKTWKWYLKENEVLTWHISTCPSKLVDCNLYLHPTLYKDSTVSFIFLQWEGFWCHVEVLKNSIVISP